MEMGAEGSRQVKKKPEASQRADRTVGGRQKSVTRDQTRQDQTRQVKKKARLVVGDDS